LRKLAQRIVKNRGKTEIRKALPPLKNEAHKKGSGVRSRDGFRWRFQRAARILLNKKRIKRKEIENEQKKTSKEVQKSGRNGVQKRGGGQGVKKEESGRKRAFGGDSFGKAPSGKRCKRPIKKKSQSMRKKARRTAEGNFNKTSEGAS